jgi:transcriptional regulator EpsA
LFQTVQLLPLQPDNWPMSAHTRSTGPGTKSRPAGRRHGGSRSATLLDSHEVESLLLNIDVSLRVHSHHQLFGWTQGMLQNLVKHDLLVCGLCGARSTSYEVDCFASPWIDPHQMGSLFQRDAELVARLVAEWADNNFHAVIYDAGSEGPLERGAFARELQRIGVPRVIVHGTYDSAGKPISLFALAGAPRSVAREEAFLVELIVPFLHLAWMRSQIKQPGAAATPKSADPLTARESEILHWVHLGKSNFEIGTILNISPFTVKNHLHKILRKLNAQNRAHAVSRALALHILDL